MVSRHWPYFVLLLVIVGGLLLGSAADGSNETGIIGEVTALKGKAPYSLPGISGVEVTAEPGGYSTVTNKRGQYELNLPPGVYEVSYSAQGYAVHTEKVMVPAASKGIASVHLFPEAQGPAVAVLKPGGRGGPAEGPIPYNTTVYINAGDSQNIARDSIRWEIRDEHGQIVNDPYIQPATPLQLEPSPIPGSSPLEYTFQPTKPGRFTVSLLLKNGFSKTESQAQMAVEAINVAPEPVPSVVGGVNTVLAGEQVVLAGWALDKNMPSPELYNPGGREPDTYGKNDDFLQRQFAWSWKLEYIESDGTREDVSTILATDGAIPAAQVQYPWFVPEKPGKYVASLVVDDRDPYGNLVSEPGSVTITVLDPQQALVPDETCLTCHDATHAPAGMSCQSCHGPGQLHLEAEGEAAKRQTISVSYDAASCASCHIEYGQWQKSRHSDGYAYGYYEIAQPLLLNCAKCHYPVGFADALTMAAESGTTFGEVEFKKPMYPNGPLFFDFSKLPDPVGEGISCQVCHDPHQISPDNEAGLRASNAVLCGTCHEEKWQNVLIEGTAGQLGSAYEYPGEKYNRQSPHNTEDKCILCHMDTQISTVDENGVAILGGHTLRMRDAGADDVLGSSDDIMNTAVCEKCHDDVTTFDLNGRQTEIKALWEELGLLLKDRNSGILPDYKPGDKCATCHRGGTMPFDVDPHLVLENAYTNYKLVKNDRSWGVHNYEYTKKLLVDSIEAVKTLY